MTVKIKSRLPKGHRDGLQHLTDRLRDEPDRVIAVVMLCKPEAITENLGDEDDPYTVTIGVGAVEVPEGLEASAVVSMLNSTYDRRTGRQPLPFGGVFDVDLDTGEIRPSTDPDDSGETGGDG